MFHLITFQLKAQHCPDILYLLCVSMSQIYNLYNISITVYYLCILYSKLIVTLACFCRNLDLIRHLEQQISDNVLFTSSKKLLFQRYITLPPASPPKPRYATSLIRLFHRLRIHRLLFSHLHTDTHCY